MQFNPIPSVAASIKAKQAARDALAQPINPIPAAVLTRWQTGQHGINPLGVDMDIPSPADSAGAQPQPPSGGGQQPQKSNATVISENLLTHIPGEATGFYLLAVSALDKPTTGNLGVVFACALILLIVARWIAKASWVMMLTTIFAFLLWMLIFDKGFLHILAPNLLPNPLGLILAGFYSALITLLASAGKIK
jgi:hypothetical protein